jgi:hypothetical protein
MAPAGARAESAAPYSLKSSDPASEFAEAGRCSRSKRGAPLAATYTSAPPVWTTTAGTDPSRSSPPVLAVEDANPAANCVTSVRY